MTPLLTPTTPHLNTLTCQQQQQLLERQGEFNRMQPDDGGSWDLRSAEYLGLTLEQYWLEYLWKPLGLVEFTINENELLRQGALFRAGIHPYQELLKEVLKE